MNFKELNLRNPEPIYRTVKINGGAELDVRTYLPIADKAELIDWVVNKSLSPMNGCISPVRFEVCFAIAVVQRYAGIEIDTDEDINEVYDILESNNVINMVMAHIPEAELKHLTELAQDTAADIARYANSFAGMVNLISTDTQNIDSQLKEIMEKIQNSEGLEQLNAIRDVVGTD